MTPDKNTKDLVVFTLLAAIIVMLGITPLGIVPLGTINATTLHIPVIVGAIILGPKKGCLLGFVFGIISMISATLSSSTFSFLFTPFHESGNYRSIIICFLPRVLVGTVSYYTYILAKKIIKRNEFLRLFIAGAIGSLTNTIFVLLLSIMFFGLKYTEMSSIMNNSTFKIFFVMILTNGIPEALLAAFVTTVVGLIIFKKRSIYEE